MASIVKVPKDNIADYDFIAFSFDGLHSYEDFGLYRTSDGDRYNENLAPQMTERTADNPARDGQYYFGTQHKQRVFDIKFAFENLTEAKLSGLKKWLNGKKVADLWFAEAPYKVYSAKVTGTPNIKALCFDEQYNDNGETKTRRIYKGEGSVQFTCYYPYAHTPDKI
jgi:predicted phage tail component-like protein